MMSTDSMKAIAISTFTDPSGYELMSLPCPTIQQPNEIIIKVHSASVNPVDLKKANGIFKLAISEEFPYIIGYDAAGVIAEVGAGVKHFKVGDEVYTRLPEINRGAWAEYAKSTEEYIALKPRNMSFNDAASLPLAAVTALQAFSKYNGSLEGKTVFIPAGLSGTGAYACQLAKNVFKAGKVITTVSTSKVARVPQLLGDGIVDQIIDYTKENPTKAITPRSVDFVFDTMGQAMDMLPIMRGKYSVIVSVSTLPSGQTLQNAPIMRGRKRPSVPLYARIFLDLGDAYRRWRAWCWGVTYMYIFLEPNAKDLEKMTQWVEDGKVKAVVGTTVQMQDINGTIKALEVVAKGKGGLGKTVIKVT